ncbi:MAG: tagaturonate epimerase family protein [Verrucomicrobia bacterium]|nr:tagaturonate epimerase family protein [Verrucomicrobiota bacterium]
MMIGKYSFGVGDRFEHQAAAQLRAFVLAGQSGADIVPVWNKSYREHTTIGTKPGGTRAAADRAVKELGWNAPYHLDADHINLKNVNEFIGSCDFFTIDVAEYIGKPCGSGEVDRFIQNHKELSGRITIPGIQDDIHITGSELRTIVEKYLSAVEKAADVYRHLSSRKDSQSLIIEISMDETDSPQTPVELLIILAAISDYKIPIQTIAPKFTGRFNKGVDYVGDVKQFALEFDNDISVLKHAINAYDLPGNLKLSVHSGSDKFSIYESIRQAMRKHDCGIHIKTAGTTWLEELIGLAEAGGDGLKLAKRIYAKAYDKMDELCAPYASVIDIQRGRLPSPQSVDAWDGEQYVQSLRHVPACSAFNPDFRQLLHVGYKVAAQLGEEYTNLLIACESTISRNVTTNIYERHMKPLFISE